MQDFQELLVSNVFDFLQASIRLLPRLISNKGTLIVSKRASGLTPPSYIRRAWQKLFFESYEPYLTLEYLFGLVQLLRAHTMRSLPTSGFSLNLVR